MKVKLNQIANKVNAILKSRVRENRKHGSVGVVIALQFLINNIY